MAEKQEASILLIDYLTKREFAEQANRTERTVDLWDRAGRGPRRVRLGNQVLYPIDEVREWLASGGTANGHVPEPALSRLAEAIKAEKFTNGLQSLADETRNRRRRADDSSRQVTADQPHQPNHVAPRQYERAELQARRVLKND